MKTDDDDKRLSPRREEEDGYQRGQRQWKGIRQISDEGEGKTTKDTKNTQRMTSDLKDSVSSYLSLCPL